MGNEAVLVYKVGFPINFIVANGTGIEKGCLLAMTDPMTAAAAVSLSQTPAGIAAQEKIASNGQTELAVYRNGYFRVKISGAVTVGDALAHSGTANFLIAVAANISGSKVFGTALETGTTGESILMELKIR